MKTLHTAAPWFVIDDTNVHPRTKEQIGGYTISTHPNHVKERVQIAQLPSYGGEHFTDKETAEANARIISCAPELLEVLDEVMNYDGIINYLGMEIVRKINAVVAKATGEKEKL